MTEEFAGLNRSGGIGTCARGLAGYLALIGYAVDVVITDQAYVPNSDVRQIDGLTFLAISDITKKDNWVETETSFAATSLLIYRHIKRERYNLVHFNEWRGSGFHTAAAKRQGLIETTVVTNIHGSSEWVRKYNQIVPGTDDFELERMEKDQIENSDVIVSPSSYLIDYYRSQGMRIRESRIINWILPQWSSNVADRDLPLSTRGRRAGQIKEIIFFGRQEYRKGIKLFVEAASTLPTSCQVDIKFIGNFSRIEGEFTGSFILRKLKNYEGSISFIADADQTEAFRELHASETSICVMPSLIENSPCVIGECFTASIPFLVCDVGGVSELIARSSKADCLIAPNPADLRKSIVRLIESGLPPIESTLIPAKILHTWRDFHFEVCKNLERGSSTQPPVRPKVSICITHHERPKMLMRALSFIERQTYDDLEVIIVDDGSISQEALECLTAIERSEMPFPTLVVRSENRYLGAARNLGAANASGDFLIFHDDDNYLEADAVEIFVKAIIASGADILTSQYYTFPDGAAVHPAPERRIRFIHIGVGGLFSFFSNRFGDANAVVRKSVFYSIGGFSEQKNVGFEDWELFLKAHLLNFKVHNIPEPLFNYRLSNDGMLSTGNVFQDYDRIFRVADVIVAPISADLLRLAGANSLTAHVNSRYISNIKKEDFNNFLFSANSASRQRLDQIKDLASYAFAIGRVYDGIRLSAGSRLEGANFDSQIPYSNTLNKLVSHVTHSYAGFQQAKASDLFIISGWLMYGPSIETLASDFIIDGTKYAVIKMQLHCRRDVAQHLGLNLDSNRLGFTALLRKSARKFSADSFLGKKIKLGVGTQCQVKSVFVSKKYKAVRGHVDIAHQVTGAELREVNSGEVCVLDLELPHERSLGCLVTNEQEVDFGYSRGHNRVIFILSQSMRQHVKIVLPVSGESKVTVRRPLPSVYAQISGSDG